MKADWTHQAILPTPALPNRPSVCPVCSRICVAFSHRPRYVVIVTCPEHSPRIVPAWMRRKSSDKRSNNHITRNAVSRQLGHRISCGRASCSVLLKKTLTLTFHIWGNSRFNKSLYRFNLMLCPCLNPVLTFPKKEISFICFPR